MNELPFITCGNARFLNLPHAKAVLNEVWDEDCYRLNEIPDGSIVLDVGAFYGEFGLICAVNKGCAVVAYEPSKINRDVTSLNFKLNGASGRYFLRDCGIAGTKSRSSFSYREDHPAGSLFNYPHQFGKEEFVICLTLSSEIENVRVRFGLERPITVKLDCEGSEVGIFQDDPDWIEHVDIVTMEWHNHDGDLYAGILEKHGFDVELEGGGPKPRPKWDKSIGGGLLFAKRKNQ